MKAVEIVAGVIRDHGGRVLTVRKRGTTAFMLPGGKRNPGEADIEKGFVSVLTPVGAALIGLTAGQAIDWTDRDGRTRRLHVLEVGAENLATAS